ncbi:MAG: helix-turn-helix domain-containing protein [Pirellulaceae bacterium]|nr:helix-turn-helix domain-containing protein [Planctomycetales bacterium]MCA9266149.1 helix-turn-helix domain-containing protein [Planctomycetales bacterium]
MANLIELKEAASLLGVSPERLVELISRKEVFGYRDGSTWKFKETELERYASQLGYKLGEAPAGGVVGPGDSVDSDLDELVDVSDMELDADEAGTGSILVSEAELGGPASTGMGSTIIGEDDLSLDDGSAAADSEIKLAGSETGSDLRLSASDSEVSVGGGSDLQVGGSGSELQLAASSDVLGGSGSISLSSDTADNIGGGDDDDLILGGDTIKAPSASPSLSDEFDLDLGGSDVKLGSSLDLDDDDADVTVTGPETGSGSDVTLGAADSGISLSNPSDSGINLSNPSESGLSLDIGSGLGSGVESLELGEDDDEVVLLGDDDDDLEAPTELRADDEFLLEPVDAAAGEEADSGSQVIALDADEFEADESSLVDDVVAEPIMDGDADFGGIAEPAPVATSATRAAAMSAPANFSLGVVLSLMGVVLLMALSGIMISDIVRNMWSWNESYSLNSFLMDLIIGKR